MSAFSYSMAFIMGLTMSLHCAGMCGPIVYIMPFQMLTGFKKVGAIALYHLGRITTYAFMAIGLYGFRGLFHAEVQNIVSIVLGILLLVLGILSFFPNHKIQIKLPWAEMVKKQLSYFVSQPQLSSLFIAGFLNGLLPCGLVYIALSASLSAANYWQAALLMYVFGFGTVPVLVGITLLKNRISLLKYPNIKRLIPIVMVVFGCIFVVRGMNLGIPYISPKIEVTQHSIKACCCHKK